MASSNIARPNTDLSEQEIQGLLSILFSFGKGLIFFVPGLLLPVRGLLRKAAPDLQLDIYGIYLLWVAFVVGLILVYSPWWAWYGGWFWGPRFFLFACIPASFAIALRLLPARLRLPGDAAHGRYPATNE